MRCVSSTQRQKGRRITCWVCSQDDQREFCLIGREHCGCAKRAERVGAKGFCMGRLIAAIGSRSCPVYPGAKETLDHAKHSPKTRGSCHFQQRLNATPLQVLPLAGATVITQLGMTLDLRKSQSACSNSTYLTRQHPLVWPSQVDRLSTLKQTEGNGARRNAGKDL